MTHHWPTVSDWHLRGMSESQWGRRQGRRQCGWVGRKEGRQCSSGTSVLQTVKISYWKKSLAKNMLKKHQTATLPSWWTWRSRANSNWPDPSSKLKGHQMQWNWRYCPCPSQPQKLMDAPLQSWTSCGQDQRQWKEPISLHCAAPKLSGPSSAPWCQHSLHPQAPWWACETRCADGLRLEAHWQKCISNSHQGFPW